MDILYSEYMIQEFHSHPHPPQEVAHAFFIFYLNGRNGVYSPGESLGDTDDRGSLRIGGREAINSRANVQEFCLTQEGHRRLPEIAGRKGLMCAYVEALD